MTTTAYRLPRHVLPVHYAIELDASPKRNAFGGRLRLTARVQSQSERVELHTRGLKIADIHAVAGKKRFAGRAVTHTDRETTELVFDAPLPKGKVEIDLTFRGKLNPNMHGLYLARDGAERAIVSQCEATDARAIFPCFDEPDLKATLQWTVRTDAGLTVITNGVLESVRKAAPPKTKIKPKPKAGKVSKARRKASSVGVVEVHRFRTTKAISTYLAAVTIGTYDLTEPRRFRRIPCRIAAGPGKLDQTDFSFDVTAHVLPWFEDYFGHRYHFEKLDQVAVPGFDAGAMENIGAIFYRQNLLLMRAGTTSWFAQKRIAEVIAHEIAHQWFGNLVTMKWWDDLWLNEAFATWIAYKAVDAWQPSWRMWDEYLEAKESALAADALVSTHPVYTPVSTPAEATELFDIITYEKGCAVLRMAESFLGDDVFREGIRIYVQRFKNGNAAGADLWGCLAEASGQPVDRLLQSWIAQSGFPLVSIEARSSGGQTVLHLQQRRFFSSGDEMQRPNEQRWEIPLVIRYDVGNGPGSFRAVMRDERTTLTLPHKGEARWVFANAGVTGFYRLDCSPATLKSLLEHGLSALSAAERTSLVDDQWALVMSGRAEITRFMQVAAALRGDADYVVARTLLMRLTYLEQRVVRDEDRPDLAEFVRWLFRSQHAALGWDVQPDEGPGRAVLRATVIEALGDLGRDPEVLANAAARLEQEIVSPEAIEANLAGTVVALAAISGDQKTLARYIQEYARRKKAGASPQVQGRYLNALASFEKPEVVASVLNLCLDGTVPQEQLRTVLGALLHRRASQRQAWSVLKENWSDIGPRCGAMGVARLVEATGSLPIDLRDDVQAFFDEHPVEEAKRARQKGLEAMALRASLIAREAARLGTWLRAQRGMMRVG